MPQPYKLNKKQKIRDFKIVYKDVFNMSFLYHELHDWLVQEGYVQNASGEENGDFWIEDLYIERINTQGAKEIWVWWRAEKNHGSSFFKFYLNIDMHAMSLMKHDIVVDGKKVATHKGEIEIFVTVFMELDPAGEWKKNFILNNNWMQNFYLNRVYKQHIEQAEQEIIKDAAKVLAAIKQYLQLESWLPNYTRRPFRTYKGQ